MPLTSHTSNEKVGCVVVVGIEELWGGVGWVGMGWGGVGWGLYGIRKVGWAPCCHHIVSCEALDWLY